MTSTASYIFDALDEINEASGAKAKQQLVRDAVTQAPSAEIGELFTRTLKYAYDSTIRFGITANKLSMPVTASAKEDEFDSRIFTFLDQVILEGRPSVKKEMIDNQLGRLCEEGRSLLFRIIDKDVRSGISEGSITKALPNLLTLFDVMLAKPFAARHVPAWPFMVEPKLDGLRLICDVNCTTKEVNFWTRSGKEITSLDNFKPEALAFGYQFHDTAVVSFDGEVTSGTFAESMSEVRSGSKQAEEGTFHVFDVLINPVTTSIALSDAELEKQGTQKERRARLVRGLALLKLHIPELKFITLTQSYWVNSEDEVYTYYAACRDAGLEGVIVKDPNAFYVKKRSAAWMKIKAQETLDLPIVGTFEGEGKYAGMLGGLIVLNDQTQVRVGGGFSDKQRVEYWEQIQKDLTLISSDNRDRCILIDCPAEIQFQEVLPSGSLRHPIFVRLRKDKQLGAVGTF